MAAPTPAQIALIRDFEPALYFFGTPGEPGSERFFPSDAKRYLESAALWRARAPFATRPDWGSPIVDAGKLGAIKNEASVFLGEKSASGIPLYLETPPDQECFFEVSGWKPGDANADLDRLAQRYATEPKLTDSQFWYHAEFFDAARLRRLFNDDVDPGGSVIDFNDLFVPQPGGPPLLTDPALICYYFFYPGHDEALDGCDNEAAREFRSFAGEWSCFSVLLDRPNAATAYAPKWVGLSNRNTGVIKIDGRELRTGLRLLPWSAMQVYEGNHSRLIVSKGSHALYLPGEAPAPVQPLTMDDLSAAHCGVAEPVVASTSGMDSTTIAVVAFPIFLGKLIGGLAAGNGILGPLGAFFGGAAGIAWYIAEAQKFGAPFGADLPQSTPTAPTDAVSPSGFVVHPKGKRPSDADPSRSIEWRSEDNHIIDRRRYDFTVDRATQVLWGSDPDGRGYTGRWGPLVESDFDTRRAGMKFPKFWREFFEAVVRNDPPARAIFLTRDAGSTWIVPADWNNAKNTVEAIGAGVSGGTSAADTALGGGGGGAYAKSVNLTLSPGQAVFISVGAAASNLGTAGDTFFNSTAATFPTSGQAVGAKGAKGRNGGAADGCYAGGPGSLTNFGGDGGNPAWGGGGGGGAGGPSGKGGDGGTAFPGANGGGGGGGGGGGTDGGFAGADSGGAPGQGKDRSGAGGTGATAPQGASGRGVDGKDWDDLHGAGGGGGGGGGDRTNTVASTNGGDGGNYGSGGGAGGSRSTVGGAIGGKGSDGLIVIRYTPS